MRTFAKAIVAAVGGLITGLTQQLEAAESFGNISDLGWVLIVGLAFSLGTAVYFTPNAKPEPPA